MKEVIIFSEQGEPTNINTWSNVPFFLIKNLESNGIKTHGVNLAPSGIFEKLIQKVWMLIYGKHSSFYNYTRSTLYFKISRYRIKKALKKYSHADACIFTTFSHSATGLTQKPTILFCDWTIEHYFEYFLERSPVGKEKEVVERQNQLIEKADFVFVLFPGIANKVKKRYRNPHIYYNGNVVNNLATPSSENINVKEKGNSIVFIGSKKYIEGAKALLSAFIELKHIFSDLTLDFIGLDSNAFESLPSGVTCHGYLNKGIQEQANKYYDLLTKAKLFINTTSKWGAFSASLEAMYFYTPVLLTPYDEFLKTFGEKIDFGLYFHSQQNNLAETIKELIISKDYRQMCFKAHEAAKVHTWEKYVSNMLKTITPAENHNFKMHKPSLLSNDFER